MDKNKQVFIIIRYIKSEYVGYFDKVSTIQYELIDLIKNKDNSIKIFKTEQKTREYTNKHLKFNYKIIEL